MNERRRHEGARYTEMMVRRETQWRRLPAEEQAEIDRRLPWSGCPKPKETKR